MIGTEKNKAAVAGDYRTIITFDQKNCGKDLLQALEDRNFGFEVNNYFLVYKAVSNIVAVSRFPIGPTV